MTCAKRRVVCIITSEKTGEEYYGENFCLNPQETCPRLEGEGYEKCKSICQQQGHAEEQAIEAVEANGDTLFNATVQVYGHDHYCANCQRLLFSKGVDSLSLAWEELWKK